VIAISKKKNVQWINSVTVGVGGNLVFATFFNIYGVMTFAGGSVLRRLLYWWNALCSSEVVWLDFHSPHVFYLLVHNRCRGCLFSLDHTQTHTTVGRTPLDEGSARRRDLYLTTQTLYNRQTFMPLVQFEPAIPASARQQIYALDRAATGIGHGLHVMFIQYKNLFISSCQRSEVWNCSCCMHTAYRLRMRLQMFMVATHSFHFP
jgi:hypothetical protein